MTRHVRNYFRHFQLSPGDSIQCEIPGCAATAVDIHHIEPRSKFGSRTKCEQDNVNNLVALCRTHHSAAHGIDSRAIKEQLKTVALNRKSI